MLTDSHPRKAILCMSFSPQRRNNWRIFFFFISERQREREKREITGQTPFTWTSLKIVPQLKEPDWDIYPWLGTRLDPIIPQHLDILSILWDSVAHIEHESAVREGESVRLSSKDSRECNKLTIFCKCALFSTLYSSKCWDKFWKGNLLPSPWQWERV